jgi:hypothetical protein
MANTPVPQNYQTILSNMLDVLTAKTGIKSLKVGNPLLSLLEAAAQSDLRSSQTILDFLKSISLDDASGQSLDFIALSEGTARIGALSAQGFVNFTDTTFSKISTDISIQGPLASAGSTSITVLSTDGFPSTGALYIGRGTANEEGPVAYTSKTDTTFTISPLTLSHAAGETVILAQGGLRVVSAGTEVSVLSGIGTSIKFNTINEVKIFDGESEVVDVPVLAQTPGVTGNVIAGSITEVSSTITGLTVLNSRSTYGGSEVESDFDLRERIRKLRQSRSKGTAASLESGVLGALAEDGQRIASATVVEESGKSTLYIDNGKGYEETFGSIPYEALTTSAVGGEQYFELSERPVAQANLISANPAPWLISPNSTLSVIVENTTSTHTFTADDFKNYEAASAYEVVASINANDSLLFSAKVVENGTKIAIFAKSEYLHRLKLDPQVGDSNVSFNFPLLSVDTLNLYKNKTLLLRDSSKATIISQPQSVWSGFLTGNVGDTVLSIAIDNTPTLDVKWSQDDENLYGGISYLTSTLEISLWAEWLDSKLPGVTVSVKNNSLVFESISGEALAISGCKMVTLGAFLGTEESVGVNADYSLNINTAQIKLVEALEPGDSLEVGTEEPAAFIEIGNDWTTGITLSGTVYFVIDGDVEVLTDLVPNTLSYTVSSSASIVTYTATPTTNFSSIFDVGTDWAIVNSGATTLTPFISRIVNTSTTTFSTQQLTTDTKPSPNTFTDYAFFRTAKIPQKLIVNNTTYTAQDFADLINAQIVGVDAIVYKNRIRIYTNNEGDDGEVAVVSVYGDAGLEGLMVEHVASNPAQVAAILQSQSSWDATTFQARRLEAATNLSLNADIEVKDHVEYGVATNRWSYWPFFTGRNDKLSIIPALSDSAPSIDGLSNFKAFDIVTSKTTGTYDFSGDTVNNADEYAELNVKNTYAWVNKFLGSIAQIVPPVAISHDDSLSFIIDNEITKNYKVDFGKEVTITDPTWDQSLIVTNPNGSITGTFNEHTLFVQARGGSHQTTDLEITWKHKRFGAEGEATVVSIEPPESPTGTLSGREEIVNGDNYCKIFMPAGTNHGLNLESGRKFHNISLGNFATDPVIVKASPLEASNEYLGRNDQTLGVGTRIYFSNTNVLGDQSSTDLTHNYKVGDYIWNKYSGVHQLTNVQSNFIEIDGKLATLGTSSVDAVYFIPIPCGTVIVPDSIELKGREVELTFPAPHPEFAVGSIVYFSGTNGFTSPNYNDHVKPQLCQVINNSGSKIVISVPNNSSDVTYTSYSPTAFLSTHYTNRRTVVESNFNILTGDASKSNTGVVTCTFYRTPAMRSLGIKNGDLLYIITSATNFGTYNTFVQVYDVQDVPAGRTFKYQDSNNTAVISSNAIIEFQYKSGVFSWAPSVSGDCYMSEQDYFAVKNGYSKSMPLLPETSNSRLDFYDWGATNGVPTAPSTTDAIKVVEIDYSTVGNVEAFVNGSDLSVTADYQGGAPNTLYTDSTLNECYKTTLNSTLEGEDVSVPAFKLYDGENTISTAIVSGSDLALNLRWPTKTNASGDVDGQTVKIVPNSPEQIAKWMANPAFSAIPSIADSTIIENGLGVQLSRVDIGSGTSIQYSGGSANSRIIQANGNPIIYNNRRFALSILKGLSGFTANQWVKVTNTQSKVIQPLSDATNVTLSTSVPNVTINGSTLIRESQTLPAGADYGVTIKEQGDLLCATIYPHGSGLNYRILPNVVPGDKLDLSKDALGSEVYIQGDIVGRDINTFWIKGLGSERVLPNLSGKILVGFKDNCFAPGTKLLISNSTVGNSVVTLTEIYGGNSGQGKQFKATGIVATEDVTIGNCTFLTPDDYSCYAKVVGYSTGEGDYDYLILETQWLPDMQRATAVDYISANPTITVLNKLQFPTEKSVGTDGYKYNTGLLAEANRIVYGDEAKSMSYPGLHASGTVVDISGPMIKRLSISLTVRLSTANTKDLVASIKNAVAKTINSSYVSQNVAISDIIESVNRIRGVESVVVTSPIYNVQNDLIPVKLGEKALILDPETDIDVLINE